MKVQFLPQQWLFWVCHIGGWLCVSLPFVHLDVGQLDAVLTGTGARDGASYSWQTELLRFILSLPVLLWYRYLFVSHNWRQLVPVELVSLTLGFNLIFALFFSYMLPYNIPRTEWWFEWFQKESSGTTREFDEKLISFLYSYSAQLLWCFFYVLIHSLKTNKTFEQQEERMQGELKTAMISSLSSQISPHFLFNAMNNICCLMDEDVGKAQTALRAFSDVLRFSLNDSVNQTISIKEEMDLVQNYMEVVSIQFEDKLRFSAQISEDVLTYSIPPMIIQLLVENAIKHGISQLKQGGVVTVKIAHESLGLRLVVENTGILQAKKNSHKRCVGLKNIQERLLLVYGDRATFQLYQRNTEVQAQLDAEQMEADMRDKEAASVIAEIYFPKIRSA
ncbi:Sensor histidine kinase YpdA [Thalassocella blandensis]|nr:Sensor histidine kinase YpdA [Thalassocella blandensis]